MVAKLEKILELDYVNGCLLISNDGQIHYNHLPPPMLNESLSFQWPDFVQTLGGMSEADILFENKRLYLRLSPIGYLIVIMENFADIAMVRLQCDVLVPTLQPPKDKGLKRLFSKKQN